MKSTVITRLPLLLLLFVSVDAFAHVRWFVDDQQASTTFTFDRVSILLVLGAIIYCYACYLFNKHANNNNKQSLSYRFLFGKFSLKGLEWKIFEIGIAIMLIGNMATGVFFAPNLIINDNNLSLLLQGALIICLLFDRVVFAVALAIIVGMIVNMFGFELAIDYAAEFISFAIALALVGAHGNWISQPDSSLSRRIVCTNAASILRIGMGLQLVILAIHNKILNPDLGLLFLQQHPEFNFMQLLGLSAFENIHFVLSAGLAETCFGLLLIFNIATRFVASCVLGIFTLTSIVLGLHELLGHLPVLAATFVIWLNGSATAKLDLRLFIQAIYQQFSKTRLLQS